MLPSNSFSSLHFTPQGKSPQVVDPRLGAPFPDLAVEEALGQWKGLLSTVGLSGGVRPSLNPPTPYTNARPGLISAPS